MSASKQAKTAQFKPTTYHLEQVRQNEALQTLQAMQRNLVLPPCPVPCHSTIIQGDLDGAANQHQPETPAAPTVLASCFTGCRSFTDPSVGFPRRRPAWELGTAGRDLFPQLRAMTPNVRLVRQVSFAGTYFPNASITEAGIPGE